MGLIILIISIVLGGCGTKQTPSSNTQQNAAATQAPNAVHLTPVPAGTPLVTANTEVSKQIMAQKDVLGTQIYEQNGIVYGDITFKSGVTKDYAHNLANEFLTQLKTSYPGRSITAQVVIDGKTTDFISFKP
ncbi:hypothetical protein [Desulfosporosinus sp. I2]|uniref:hypothetical protein n=1 Tax=Desulfosporosinus sp. I2 TaxID=1617025 RepID=UPI001FA729B2|nr:hypothetical protein [Desulfosporosinus sp. I2]